MDGERAVDWAGAGALARQVRSEEVREKRDGIDPVFLGHVGLAGRQVFVGKDWQHDLHSDPVSLVNATRGDDGKPYQLAGEGDSGGPITPRAFFILPRGPGEMTRWTWTGCAAEWGAHEGDDGHTENGGSDAR